MLCVILCCANLSLNIGTPFGLSVVRNKRGNRELTKPPLISGLLFLALGIVTYLPLYWFPITDLPAPSGQYSVGTQDFGLTDDSRKGVLGAPDGEPRKLLARVWYPTETTEGFRSNPIF